MRRYAVLLLLAALSMLLSACGLMPAEDVIPESPTIASYEQETQKLETVMRGDLASVTTVDCKFMPAKKESLSFSVDGTLIGNIHVSLGASVEAGQVVAELSNNLQQQILEIEYQKRVQQVKKRHLQEARDLEVKRYDIILSHLEQELEKAEAQVKPIINLQKQTYEENRRSKLADYDSKIQAASDAIYLQKLQLNSIIRRNLEGEKNDNDAAAIFDRAADALLTWMKGSGVPAYDETTGKGLIRHLFLRAGSRGFMACIVAAGDIPASAADAMRSACPELTGVLLCRNDRPGNTVLTDDIRPLWGAETVEQTGAKLVIPVHWDNFFSPLDKPVIGMPKFVEHTETVFFRLAKYCEAHAISCLVQIPRTSIEL